MTSLNNHDNIAYDEGQMPSLHEQLEMRRVFAHIRLDKPNVGKEWDTWVRSIDSTHQITHHKAAIKWITLLVAACVAALVVIYGLHDKDVRPQGVEVFTANASTGDVTLTTDDDKPVKVNSKSLSFTKQHAQPTAHMRTIAVSIPRGKNFQVVLPDGSKVFLNAESKIEFPDVFASNERRVKIDGEAYMEIKADSRHPFVVTTDYFNATVLGTEFNLRAYSSKDASLTLVKGRVEVSDLSGKQRQTLKPDEQLVLDADKGFTVSPVDTYPIIQWKNGYFYFDKATLSEIMQELGRWYNITVVFENISDMGKTLHFAAGRDEELATIIKRLNDLEIVNVEYKDRVVTIK